MLRLATVYVTAGLLSLCGCYAYQAVDPSALPPGSEVRIQLSDPEANRVRAFLGVEEDLGTMEGRIENGDVNDSLYLSVSLGHLNGSSVRRDLRAMVPVSRVEIREAGIRTLNRRRTAATVVVSALLAAVIVETQFDAFSGREGSDDSGGVDQALIPLFRFRW